MKNGERDDHPTGVSGPVSDAPYRKAHIAAQGFYGHQPYHYGMHLAKSNFFL
jgi:hypothetical protein